MLKFVLRQGFVLMMNTNSFLSSSKAIEGTENPLSDGKPFHRVFNDDFDL